MEQNWEEKKLSSKVVYEGRVITVTEDKVLLPNQKEGTRELVHHNGGAAILPMHEDGSISLVQQYRYPFGKVLLEIAAGRIEKGEDPKEAAIREMREELGLLADTVISLGEFYPTCGFCNEIIYLYAAKGLTQVEQDLDPDEFVLPVRFTLEEMFEKIDEGEIKDGKSIAAALKLQRLLDKKQF